MYLPRKTGLSGGWRGFSIAKGLVHGDAVVFQLVDSITFKVYILRANDIAAAAHLRHQAADEASSESWEEESLGQLKKVKRESRSAAVPQVPDAEQDRLCDVSEESAGVVPMSRDSSSLRQTESQPNQQQLLQDVAAAAPATPAPPRISSNNTAPCGARGIDGKQEAKCTKRMVRIGQSDYVVDVQEEQGDNYPATRLNSSSYPRSGPISRETRPPPQSVWRQWNTAPLLPAANASLAAQSPSCHWQESGKKLVLRVQLRNCPLQDTCTITGCSSCAQLKLALARSDEILEAAAEESARLKFRMTCKACLDCEASVLLLPCRHLCLCGSCQAGFHHCPVCNSAKVSCVRVFLS